MVKSKSCIDPDYQNRETNTRDNNPISGIAQILNPGFFLELQYNRQDNNAPRYRAYKFKNLVTRNFLVLYL